MEANIKKKVGFLGHVQVNPLFGPSSSLRSMLSLEHFTLELYESIITQVLPCEEMFQIFWRNRNLKKWYNSFKI